MQLILAGPAPVITVQIIKDKVFHDIDFLFNIACEDFFSRVFANMLLDRATAQLGWKTNDEPKRGPAHRLATNEDVDAAFREIAKMKTPRRRKEAVLDIIHLVCFFLI